MSVWFVTPAHQRVELTAVCLEQRVLVREELAKLGVEAHCVVIADDENLDVARALGMHTVERDNTFLSRKFNDGEEYAGRRGAEWIVPLGSDAFVDPAYFLPLPQPRHTRTSAMYAPVEVDRLAELKVGRIGAGPHMFHRSLMEPVGFRPLPETLNKNCDYNTVVGFRRPLTWEWRDVHPLQNIGFRYHPLITSYAGMWRKWGVVERTDPWQRLAAVYPPDLVERARLLMERQAEVAA